jgi:hypothetical protein
MRCNIPVGLRGFSLRGPLKRRKNGCESLAFPTILPSAVARKLRNIRRGYLALGIVTGI